LIKAALFLVLTSAASLRLALFLTETMRLVVKRSLFSRDKRAAPVIDQRFKPSIGKLREVADCAGMFRRKPS
jgi:hypothetical protein